MKGSYLSERGIEAPRVEREGGRKKKCTGKSQFKASGHSRRHECPLSLDTLFGVYKDRQTGAYGEPGGWTWRRRDAERERERDREEKVGWVHYHRLFRFKAAFTFSFSETFFFFALLQQITPKACIVQIPPLTSPFYLVLDQWGESKCVI